MVCRSTLETELSREGTLIYFSSMALVTFPSPGTFLASLEGLRADVR